MGVESSSYVDNVMRIYTPTKMSTISKICFKIISFPILEPKLHVMMGLVTILNFILLKQDMRRPNNNPNNIHANTFFLNHTQN